LAGKTIAVEEGLSSTIIEALTKEGYRVVKPGAGVKADATVITGMDRNIMGVQDIVDKSAVIDASGKTADEILKDLHKRL